MYIYTYDLIPFGVVCPLLSHCYTTLPPICPTFPRIFTLQSFHGNPLPEEAQFLEALDLSVRALGGIGAIGGQEFHGDFSGDLI